MKLKYVLLWTLNCLVLSLGGCHVYSNYYEDYTLIIDDAQIQYLYTEELNLDNVYLLGADDSIVYVTANMITKYDYKLIGKQEVEITYNKITFYYEIEIQYSYD